MNELELLYEALPDPAEYPIESESQAIRIHRRARAVVEQLEAEGSTHRANWRRNERYFDSDFFDMPKSVMEKRMYVTFNETRNHIRHLAAWLTDRTPKLLVYPAYVPLASINPDTDDAASKAKIMQRYLTAAWTTKRWHLVFSDLIMDSMIYGSGIIKAYWDPYALGGLGDVALQTVSPWQFYVDEAADCLDNAWAVLEIQEPYELELRRIYPFYPGESEGREDQKPDVEMPQLKRGPKPVALQITSSSVVESSIPGGGGGAAEQSKIGKVSGTVKKYCLYLKDFADFPTGKRVVWHKLEFTPNHFLSATRYEDLPFAHLRFAPHHENVFWGQSYVDMVADIQRSTNVLACMINRAIHQIAEPVWVEERGARSTQRIKRVSPGDRMTVNDGYWDRVGYKQPGTLGRDAYEFLAMLLKFHENVSGISGPMRTAQTEPRVVAGTQQMAAEATQVLVRMFARALEQEAERILTYVANQAAERVVVGRRIPLTDDESPDRFLDLGDFAFYYKGAEEPQPMRFVVHFEAGTSMAVNQTLRVSNALRYYMATGGKPGPLWLARQFQIEGAAEMLDEAGQRQDAKLAPKKEQLSSALGKLAEAVGALERSDNAQSQRPGNLP